MVRLHRTISAGSLYPEADRITGRPGSEFLVQHLREVAIDHTNGIFAGTNEFVETIGGQPPLTVEAFVAKHRDAEALGEMGCAFPKTRGERPENFEKGQQFEAALFRAVVADPIVHRAMTEVDQLLQPQSKFHEPHIKQRIEAASAQTFARTVGVKSVRRS